MDSTIVEVYRQRTPVHIDTISISLAVEIEITALLRQVLDINQFEAGNDGSRPKV
jgi:hypothetical protein